MRVCFWSFTLSFRVEGISPIYNLLRFIRWSNRVITRGIYRFFWRSTTESYPEKEGPQLFLTLSSRIIFITVNVIRGFGITKITTYMTMTHSYVSMSTMFRRLRHNLYNNNTNRERSSVSSTIARYTYVRSTRWIRSISPCLNRLDHPHLTMFFRIIVLSVHHRYDGNQ